jgi:1,4-alpha-glucan branching enzyme
MNATSLKQKQTFAFNAPAAQSVLLVGDFTEWQKNPIALAKQPNGIWKTTASLPPGTYHYRFLVDGEWRDDPDCTLRVANPFGTQDDIVVVGGKPHHGAAPR